MKRVAVFCGSSEGARPVYRETARETGAMLARRGIAVVYGGGRSGLMGAVAEGALSSGGEITGVIPHSLMRKEWGHEELPDLRVVETMHERKAMMADMSDAFLALPGGCGTFEEFFEVLTWAQIGLHRKPVALLNVDGYYDPLLALLDHAVTERFVRAEHRRLVLTDSDPSALLDALTRAASGN